MRYRHLVGLPYDPKSQHCYTLVREIYAAEYGINLPDFAYPQQFWRAGLDIFTPALKQFGFEPQACSPHDYRSGDLILIAKGSAIPNHIGIYLDNTKILHHLIGDVSKEDPYLRGGYWRSLTVGVYRHPDVKPAVNTEMVSLWSVLPENVRSRLVEQGVDPEAAGALPRI